MKARSDFQARYRRKVAGRAVVCRLGYGCTVTCEALNCLLVLYWNITGMSRTRTDGDIAGGSG